MNHNRYNHGYKSRGNPCPRCNASTILCQNRYGGWFTGCKKCAYTGPPETFFGEVVTYRR